MSALSMRAGDILWTQLKEMPPFRAMIRGMEARLFMEYGPLRGPVLDLGCGDGHFADAVMEYVDVGIDLEDVSLIEARARGVYGAVLKASATELPFDDGSFSTVFSNCVIEHIPDIRAVFSESARVLKPGGEFIYSVPTDRLNQQLGITRLLETLGASALSEQYQQWFAGIQMHYHMYSRAGWRALAEEAGLTVVRETGYMSARATALFDLGHLYSVPNLLWRRLTGEWVMLPWRPRFALEESVLAPLIAENDPADASCCFFVAKKV